MTYPTPIYVNISLIIKPTPVKIGVNIMQYSMINSVFFNFPYSFLIVG